MYTAPMYDCLKIQHPHDRADCIRYIAVPVGRSSPCEMVRVQNDGFTLKLESVPLIGEHVTLLNTPYSIQIHRFGIGSRFLQ